MVLLSLDANTTDNSTTSRNASIGTVQLQVRNDNYVFVARLIVIILGSVGNLGLLRASWKERIARSGTRLLLLNLATSAFLRLAFAQSGILVFTYAQVPGSCPFYAFGILFAVVSNWAEAALAINRVFAVSYPYLYKRISSIRISVLLCVAAWSIGIVTTALVPSGLGSEYRETRPGTCVMVMKNGFGNFLNMSITVVPMSFTGLAIVRLLSTFLDRRRVRGHTGSVIQHRGRVAAKTLVLARALIASFVWCFLATVPWVIIVNLFPRFPVWFPIIAEALRLLAVAEYAVNPFIFLVFYHKHWTGQRKISSFCTTANSVAAAQPPPVSLATLPPQVQHP